MRNSRIKNDGEAFYHLVSRCCLRSFLFSDVDKDVFVRMMRRVEYFSGIEIMSFCIMDNHFHILAHVPKKQDITEDMILDRVRVLYGDIIAEEMNRRWKDFRKIGLEASVVAEQDKLRKRMGDISPFMQCLKQRFSVWYRAHHGYDGTIWQGRFGSTLVEGAEGALSTISAYIDLNPVRAGIVKDPKDYKWSSYGAAISGDHTAMRGLAHLYNEKSSSRDFLKKFACDYRKKLYINGLDSIDHEEVKRVIKEKGKLPLTSLLRCKVLFFTKSAIFGSRDFVDAEFEKHKHSFGAKRKSGARSIGICENWDGVRLYSARRLTKASVSVSA